MVRQIEIDGQLVGLVGIDEILAKVKEMGLGDDEEIKNVLLEKARSKNWIPDGMEKSYREALLEEYMVFTGRMAERPRRRNYVEIRVYGAGCPVCRELDREVTRILGEKGLAVDYEYVKDLKEIAAKRILASPAMTINDKIVVSGKIPGRKELERLILEAVK